MPGETPKPSPEGSAPVDPEIAKTGEEQGADVEALKERIENLGHAAIIATGYNEEDRKNVVAEAIDLKYKEDIKGNKLKKVATMLPLVGAVIKAGYIAKHKANLEKAIEDNHGDLRKAYQELGLNPEDSMVLNSNSEQNTDRAWQIIDNGIHVHDDESGADYYRSRLDQKDRVEQLKPETQSIVKNALNEYYFAVKEGKKSEEELENLWEDKISGLYEKEDDPSSLMGLINKEKEGLKALAKDQEAKIADEKVETYLKDHLTLYRATLREGVYKEKQVDNITKAVVAKGLAGGVLAALSVRELSKIARGAATTLGATGGIAGGVAGAALGAIRGYDKANAKLADSEIKDATTFDTGTEAEPAASAAEPEATSEVSSEASEPGAEETPETESDDKEGAKNKQKKIGSILAAVSKFNDKHFTKETETLKEINELRKRENAADIIDKLTNLTADFKPENQEELRKLYTDTIARSRFSSEKNIDLIKYNKNSDMDERGELERLLALTESLIFPHDTPESAKEAFDIDEDAIVRMQELQDDYDKAEALEKSFRRRTILVNSIVGAAVGTAAGTVAGHVLEAVSDNMPEGGVLGILHIQSGESTPDVEDAKFELTPDEDGGFMLKLGDHELIGEGDNPGINFENDGTLTEESQEMLKEAGIDFEPHMSEPIESARANVSLKEFFDLDNKEANNLTEIDSRSWITDNGRDLVVVGGSHMNGDGDIVMDVVARDDDVDLDGMKMFITPGDGNISSSITVDVNPDGTVEIPAGSPAASFFEGGEFKGGYAEFGYEDGEGHINVFSTLGDGHSDIDSVSIPSEEASYIDGYSFTLDGQSQEVTLPEEIVGNAKMEAINGIASIKGTGEGVYSESTGDVTNLVTNSGEAVEVEHFEHHGGYSDIYDSYFGEKDGVYNSGGSLVRQMLGSEGEGLSSQQADQLFLEKVNNGEIAESDVIEDYLNTMGNSPEAIVTTRSMMGDFRMDIDGDGAAELIDTQDEINAAADILGSGDSEAYDNFVNDTYDTFYEKLAGGSIRFVDQAQEQYQYTTWGILGDNNNILQRLGIVGDRPTDGVGLIFLDKNGNSIYDEATVRKLWHLPDDYNINYLADRLDCIQKTARGYYGDTGNEGTGNEGTGKEGTGNEGTGDEDTGNEGTGHEGTGDEDTGNEGTGKEGTGDEPTGDEPTGDEPTGSEPTGDEPTGDEPTGSEPTGDEPTGDEPTGDEPTGEEVVPKTDDPHAGDETDLPVTPPQEDDYVQPTPDNHVDPDVKPGSQVDDAPADNSAHNPVDHDTSSGNDTKSSYSTDTSKWKGDDSGGSSGGGNSGGGGGNSGGGGGNSGGGGGNSGGSSGGGNSGGGGGNSGGGGGGSHADPGSAGGNEHHSDEDLANINKGED